MLVLFALGLTLAATVVSTGVAAVVSGLRAEAAARARARVRAAEMANLAAAAQRWRLTPAALGGPTCDGYADLSFAALGLTTRLFRPDERRTASGVYRLVPIPAGPVVDAAARRAGVDEGEGALLVIGHDPVSGEDAAVVVLSPLVQVPLARVPRAWIAALSQPEPESAPVAAHRPPRPRPASGDRCAVPRPTALRLVGWPPGPAISPPEATGVDPPPLRVVPFRRRAA